MPLDVLTRNGRADLVRVLGEMHVSSGAWADAAALGAACDGVSDDSQAINNTAFNVGNSGGGLVVIPGLAAIGSTVFLPANTRLLSIGPAGGLTALASLAGSYMVQPTGDLAGIQQLRLYGGSHKASATNPAITGAIGVSGARLFYCADLQIYFVNGWCVESIGGATINNVGSVLHAIHANHCAQGIHLKGVSGSNYVGQMRLSDIILETIDNGDGLFLDNINDCQITNFGGAAAGGSVSGSMIHVKGGASNTLANLDVGMIATGTVSPTILLETGDADPNNITFVGGVSQNGNNALQVTAANNASFAEMLFKHANLDGVNISGGNPILFNNCTWATNNQSNGTAYEVNNSQGSGNSWFRNCTFQSPVGSGVGTVTNPINDTNHRSYFFGCGFIGSGTTPANVFAGAPKIVRNSVGYNPRGSITPPTITASPFTSATAQDDVNIIFTSLNGGSISAFKINGTSLGVPVLNVAYHVSAQTSVEIDYSTAAPTWLWIAD